MNKSILSTTMVLFFSLFLSLGFAQEKPKTAKTNISAEKHVCTDACKDGCTAKASMSKKTRLYR